MPDLTPSPVRLVVLVLLPEGVAHGFADLLPTVIGDRHQVRRLVPGRPIDEQLRDVDMVVDVAMSRHAREVVDALRDDRAPRLRLWQVMGTGTDHVATSALGEHGVRVAYCPGDTGAVALAEHALHLMLALVRRAGELSVHPWRQTMAGELSGRTLGVLGLGASGVALSVRAHALGMRVVALTTDGATRPGAVVDDVHPVAALRAVAPGIDVLSLHVPLTDSTRGIVDAAVINALPRDALLVNVARGGLIDERAVVAALIEGRLGGAGIDTFAHEPLPEMSSLATAPRTVLTPHVAGRTTGTAGRRAAIVRDACDRLAAGLPVQHLVPVPSTFGRNHETQHSPV